MDYKVVLLALVLIAGSVSAIYYNYMPLFMGLFFIIFSIAKLLDLKGFQKAFSMYDLLAKRSKFYGLFYPFIELALGVLFITETQLIGASIATIIIMGFGSIGVFQALKKNLMCACLGTKIGIPLTKVTLFENVLMVVMSFLIIF